MDKDNIFWSAEKISTQTHEGLEQEGDIGKWVIPG
jgi:hypothetical protein